MRGWLAYALLAGCSFREGTLGNSPQPDGKDVAPPDAQVCFGTPAICLSKPPSGMVTLPPPNPFDTNVSANCTQVVAQTDGTSLCVVAAATITINSMTATGNRPLVVIASDTIHVVGTLDVSSTLSGQQGAGMNFASCDPSHPGVADGHGGGGGAGGSFGGKGGDGGKGASQFQQTAAAGTAQSPPPIRGGCPGASGGDGDQNHRGGSGGNSGGAIALIAGSHVQIDGNVFASGAGGQRGTGGNTNLDSPVGGGGGAGSGGLIALDAPMISVVGIVAANGGGGGGGGGDNGSGNAGDDGTTMMYAMAAHGGAGGGDMALAGGDGGNAAAPGQNRIAGGGGGGGGAGVIWVHGALSGTKLSPTPTSH